MWCSRIVAHWDIIEANVFFEIRVDFGPGYRAYFGKDGETVVVVLGGSAKKDQQRAISEAVQAWAAYKQAKRAGRR
ncbi:MAG: hypothetical protein HYU77_03740 [Betaproteobacteria bacterium]|nr:hypothetical protein [Betaproteobacteria bacterium]